MSAYNVALFVHLLGVIVLFVAFGFTQRGGAGVRRAQTLEQVRLWLGLLQTASAMFPAAFLLILIGGLYMTADVWSFTTPWIVVGLVAVALMLVVGVGVIGRGLSRMGAAAAGSADAPVSPELKAMISQPAVWVSSMGLNGLALGILWLMAVKPGWVQAIAVPAVLLVLAAVVGSAALRRQS